MKDIKKLTIDELNDIISTFDKIKKLRLIICESNQFFNSNNTYCDKSREMLDSESFVNWWMIYEEIIFLGFATHWYRIAEILRVTKHDTPISKTIDIYNSAKHYDMFSKYKNQWYKLAQEQAMFEQNQHNKWIKKIRHGTNKINCKEEYKFSCSINKKSNFDIWQEILSKEVPKEFIHIKNEKKRNLKIQEKIKKVNKILTNDYIYRIDFFNSLPNLLNLNNSLKEIENWFSKKIMPALIEKRKDYE